MEPFGHRESSLFAEPTENKSFSEKNPVFFSTKLEMIRIFLSSEFAPYEPRSLADFTSFIDGNCFPSPIPLKLNKQGSLW
jgi:hypothetical protein